MHSSAKLLTPSNTTSPPQQIQTTPTSSSPSILKQCCKFSRRELALYANSSLLLLFGSQALEPLQLSKARAEENPENLEITVQTEPEENPDIIVQSEAEEKTEPEETLEITSVQTEPEEISNKKVDSGAEVSLPKRAFLEVSISGEPIGRIVIALDNDSAPVGAARFTSLVTGSAGISYRRKEFIKILPNYIQHSGVRSYGVDAELARSKGGDLAVDTLAGEWEKQYENVPGTKNVAGSVSLIVRDPLKPPPKMKLVAKQGKLVIDQEEVGNDPNGTEFIISMKDSPELDDSALVIGKVLEGMDVIERISQVKTVRENNSSPYFRAAKLIGDKRAVVAERGFNRPYSKVIITNCGLIDQP